MTDIPDWARMEAVKRFNAEWTARNPERSLPVYFDGDYTVIVLARHIAKHEQPLEDPDLATAREAAAVHNELSGYMNIAHAIRAKLDDNCSDVQIALAAIKLHQERNP